MHCTKQGCYCKLDCRIAIAKFLDRMCLALQARRTMVPLRYAAKFDPFLTLNCAGSEGKGHNPNKGRHQIVPSGHPGWKVILRSTFLDYLCQLAKSRSFDASDPFMNWQGRIYTDWRFTIPWETVGGNIFIRQSSGISSIFVEKIKITWFDLWLQRSLQ